MRKKDRKLPACPFLSWALGRNPTTGSGSRFLNGSEEGLDPKGSRWVGRSAWLQRRQEETRADFRFFECSRLKLPKSPETSPDLHQELPLATPTFENSSHLWVWSDGKLLSQHQTPAAAENTAEATLPSPRLSFTVCRVLRDPSTGEH